MPVGANYSEFLVVFRIIAVVFGYIIGSIVTGQVYAKVKGVDLTSMGSGNPGATNTLRTMGKKAGLITLIGDIAKLGIAVLLCWLFFDIAMGLGTTPEGKAYVKILEFYTAFGVIMGHNFPCFFKFKGGKGVACTGAVVLFVWQFEFPVAILAFVLVVLFTKYVSLGSIIGMTVLFLETLIFALTGVTALIYPGFAGVGSAMLVEMCVLQFIISALGIIRHHQNIGRLIKGTENKLSFKNAGKMDKQ